MKFRFFHLLILSFLFSVQSLAKVNIQAEERVKKTLAKYELRADDFDIKYITKEWSCQEGEGDTSPNNVLTVDVVSRRQTNYKGYNFPPKTIFSFCDGYLAKIVTYASEGHYRYNDFECDNEISFNKSGDLCSCRLSNETKIEGILVPKDSRIFLKKGKFWAVMVSNFKKQPQYPKTGAYTIENGEAKLYPDDHHIRCNFDE